MKPENITYETDRRVKDWLSAEKELRRYKSSLNAAECAERNAINELGKFLMPEDAGRGECFCIWYGDGLLEVTVVEPRETFQIKWRKQPSRLEDL